MPAELLCSIVLVGSDRNGKRSRGLSRWSRDVRRWSWWRFNVDAWSFRGMIPFWTAQENDCENDIKNIIQSNQRLTNWDLLTERPRTSDLSESGRIATKQATNLRAVGSRQTLSRNDWPNTRTNTSTGRSQRSEVWSLRSRSGAKGLEPARSLEPTAEALKI